MSEEDDPADGVWMHCERDGCDFYTRKAWKMDRHRLCHVDNGSSRLKCVDCGEVFSSLPRMLRHDRKTHTREQAYECKICEAEVTDINVHMRVSRAPYSEFWYQPSIVRKQFSNHDSSCT